MTRRKVFCVSEGIKRRISVEKSRPSEAAAGCVSNQLVLFDKNKNSVNLFFSLCGASGRATKTQSESRPSQSEKRQTLEMPDGVR